VLSVVGGDVDTSVKELCIGVDCTHSPKGGGAKFTSQ
jgi:hypothetical protein